MIRQSPLWLPAAFLALAATFAPSPQAESGASPASDRLWLRAASGPFRGLAADRLWLLAARQAEGSGPGAEPIQFQRLRAVVALDPAFRPALRYAATYYATVAGNVAAAHALCNEALRFRPNAGYPYLLKAILELGYAQAPDSGAAQRWLERARANGSDAPWVAQLERRLEKGAP